MTTKKQYIKNNLEAYKLLLEKANMDQSIKNYFLFKVDKSLLFLDLDDLNEDTID
jgi:hypothetical protein